MRILSILFILFFALSSCTPFLVDDDNGDSKKRDTAIGLKNFELQEIEEINRDEIRQAVNSENCEDYTDHTCHSLLGKSSPLKGPRNCFAKAIEDSLKPTCDLEEKYLNALEHFEDERDDRTVEQIEEALLALEEQKYYITDELYLIADEFDAVEQDTLDEIDELQEKNESNFLSPFIAGASRIFVGTELGSFTRCLDARARHLCLNIDFSKVKKKRR